MVSAADLYYVHPVVQMFRHYWVRVLYNVTSDKQKQKGEVKPRERKTFSVVFCI